MQNKKDSELEILFLWFPDTCKWYKLNQYSLLYITFDWLKPREFNVHNFNAIFIAFFLDSLLFMIAYKRTLTSQMFF